MAERTFAYSIDRYDAIRAVSDAWLAFARENRAPEMTRENVLGQPLWKFVAGRETRRLYEELFRRVRTGGETFDVPFRCDSADRFRFMRLALHPAPDRAIDLRGVLIREQERPFFSFLDLAFPRSDSSVSMCSLCKRIEAFESQWLEIEDAVERLDLFDSARLPALEYTICDDCASTSRHRAGGAAA